nr:LysE family translocator [Kineococcus vitellinus]
MTPGPNTFLVLRHSLHAARSGALAAVGSATGAVVWAGAVALGLAALLQQSADAYRVLKVLGGLYLVVLGVRAFTASRRTRGPQEQGGPAQRAVRARAAFGAGLLSCLLNPKVGLFFLAVVPQFAPAGSGVGATLLLGLVEAGVALCYLLVLTTVAARAVTWLRRPHVTRALERTSAVVLTAFGVGTVASAR